MLGWGAPGPAAMPMGSAGTRGERQNATGSRGPWQRGAAEDRGAYPPSAALPLYFKTVAGQPPVTVTTRSRRVAIDVPNSQIAATRLPGGHRAGDATEPLNTTMCPPVGAAAPTKAARPWPLQVAAGPPSIRTWKPPATPSLSPVAVRQLHDRLRPADMPVLRQVADGPDAKRLLKGTHIPGCHLAPQRASRWCLWHLRWSAGLPIERAGCQRAGTGWRMSRCSPLDFDGISVTDPTVRH